MNDKERILEEAGSEIVTRKGLDWRFLLTTLSLIAIGWTLAFPRIYLNNAIYYKSRDIAVLQREYETLLEENIQIRNRVEQMRFRNQVLDTLFDEDEP
jgi:hypothetical protein